MLFDAILLLFLYLLLSYGILFTVKNIAKYGLFSSNIIGVTLNACDLGVFIANSYNVGEKTCGELRIKRIIIISRMVYEKKIIFDTLQKMMILNQFFAAKNGVFSDVVVGYICVYPYDAIFIRI